MNANRKEFDITAALSNVKGVSVSEYTLVTPTLAKVIANTVGILTRKDFTDRLGAIFQNRATVVRASFRWLVRDQSALGFINLQTPVRAFDETEIKAKYQVMKANMFMDKSDESVWQVKPGSGGKYMSRVGEDNLAELIEASRVSPTGAMVRMRSVLAASVKKAEMLAYVDLGNNNMDYGFCLQTDGDKHVVLSHTTRQMVDVTAANLVGAYSFDIPRATHEAITAAIPDSLKAAARGQRSAVTAGGDLAQSKDYWERLYSYAPDYLNLVLKQVEEQAAA